MEEALDTAPAVEMYASRKQIHPKYQDGLFRRLRWAITTTGMAIFLFLPFLRWDRGAGQPDQALLFDLPGRKFYLFDLVIWPQDVFLLAVALIIMALLLFFVTTLAGRIFCGYFCFQTVWTDLFIAIETLCEGHRNQRLKMVTAPWTLDKVARKGAKHLLWLLLSLATGFAFVAYFVDVHQLLHDYFTGAAPYAAWFTLGFLTITTYIFAGFAREQVCIYMCPYSRFQGVMFDRDTLIVAYDETRGEPRLSSRRQRLATAGVGDCIDCNECVRVCPMGIDIRDGQQYQCTTCAACIDACDMVMSRVKKPKGLVRYTSLNGLEGRPSRVLRGRVFVYAALIAALVGGVVWDIQARNPVALNVIRERAPLYIALSDGGIQNNYTLRVLNMTNRAQTYAVGVAGVNGVQVEVAASPGLDDQGRPLLAVGSGEIIPFTAYLRQSRKELERGRADVTFTLTAQDESGGSDQYHSVFLRP